MLFYAVFAVAIINRRIGVALIVNWMVMTGLQLMTPDPTDPLVDFLLSPFHLEFVLGIGAADLILRGGVPAPRILTALSVIAFLTVGAMEDAGYISLAGLPGRLLYGLASAGLVLGLASAEQGKLIRVGTFPAFWGDASYSLYLVHTIVIGLIARALASAGALRFIPGWFAMLLVVVAALAVAAALHWGVERPLAAVGRHRRVQTEPAVALPPAM